MSSFVSERHETFNDEKPCMSKCCSSVACAFNIGANVATCMKCILHLTLLNYTG